MKAEPRLLPRVEALLQRFVRWADSRDDVRGALLVGSQARTDHPADVFSDVDLVVVASDASLVAQPEWPSMMGEPRITFVEESAVGGFRERRVLYADGLDVDYNVIPVSALETVVAVAAGVLDRGCRVLVDKDSELAPLIASLKHAGETASADTAIEPSSFWYHAVWTARKLARGELVTAHDCLDFCLRASIISLLRLHAHGRDTWHERRFLEEWVEPSLMQTFRDTYATLSATDMARALTATMDLYSLLLREVAPAIGSEYSASEERFAREQVREALARIADSDNRLPRSRGLRLRSPFGPCWPSGPRDSISFR